MNAEEIFSWKGNVMYEIDPPEKFSFGKLTDAELGYFAKEINDFLVKWYACCGFEAIKKQLADNWGYFVMTPGDVFKPKFCSELSIKAEVFINLVKKIRSGEWPVMELVNYWHVEKFKEPK